jgi:hypothetical protein
VTTLKTSKPPTYTWVLITLLLAVIAAAPVGWGLFWLVSG